MLKSAKANLCVKDFLGLIVAFLQGLLNGHEVGWTVVQKAQKQYNKKKQYLKNKTYNLYYLINNSHMHIVMVILAYLSNLWNL